MNNIQIIEDNKEEKENIIEDNNDDFDINIFKEVIRKQNLTLLSVNIKELQTILNLYLDLLEKVNNNEEYLINLFKL